MSKNKTLEAIAYGLLEGAKGQSLESFEEIRQELIACGASENTTLEEVRDETIAQLEESRDSLIHHGKIRNLTPAQIKELLSEYGL